MEVAVVEAMKMQNSLMAMKSGTVKKIHVEVGAQVAEEDLIMEMEGWTQWKTNSSMASKQKAEKRKGN